MKAALRGRADPHHRKETVMTFTTADIVHILTIAAGLLILIMPRLLNYVVALYLIVTGLFGLNAIHHFIK
jgi:hypothetical protein